MSAFRLLVANLEAKGLHLAWGPGGAKLRGDPGKLTPEMLDAMRAHRRELEALALWGHLQDESEAKFGYPAARLYPFLPRKHQEFWTAPVIRTPVGRAHLVQVFADGARVVKAVDVERWQEGGGGRFSGPSFLVSLVDVWPPVEPPTDPAEVYQPYGEMERNQ